MKDKKSMSREGPTNGLADDPQESIQRRSEKLYSEVGEGGQGRPRTTAKCPMSYTPQKVWKIRIISSIPHHHSLYNILDNRILFEAGRKRLLRKSDQLFILHTLGTCNPTIRNGAPLIFIYKVKYWCRFCKNSINYHAIISHQKMTHTKGIEPKIWGGRMLDFVYTMYIKLRSLPKNATNRNIFKQECQRETRVSEVHH